MLYMFQVLAGNKDTYTVARNLLNPPIIGSKAGGPPQISNPHHGYLGKPQKMFFFSSGP